MLTVNNLQISYGAVNAVKGVTFHVDEGEIVSLIGANGAGKTTVMHGISGLIPAFAGQCTFKNQNISGVSPHKITAMGLAQVPERRRVFARMTVKENLALGAYLVKSPDYQQAYDMFPRLYERRKQTAGTLSGGEQQMLAIGRALMSHPKMLLLDEPSMGLSPILVQEIFKIIRECSRKGMTILLVEQNASMALSLSNRAYVLETGKMVLEGSAQEFINNEEVRKAYLGV